MIHLASDHGGFELKKAIAEFLRENEIEFVDSGSYILDPDDDYPDFIIPAVANIKNDPSSRGIFICRNGVGVCVLANKFSGIRAALSWGPDHARSSVLDDNTNVLCLAADYIPVEQAIDTVKMWLNTKFEQKERHVRRLNKYSHIGND